MALLYSAPYCDSPVQIGSNWSESLRVLSAYDIDRGDQMLFIDADASDGFWDKIGMVESKRYGYDRNPKYSQREGAGYEKYITINKLYGFARS